MQVLCLLLLASCPAVAGWLMWFSHHGFDFTDEGHYINSIAQPGLYPVNLPLTLFGHVLNPVYAFLGSRIDHMRLAGIAFTASLGWMTAWLILRAAWSGVGHQRLSLAAMASAAASLALAWYALGLFTPSYNLLAFHALMIIVSGIALIARERLALLGWALIGLGGWLLFMAKPSSAAILAVTTPLCLIALRRFTIRGAALAGSIATALLLISAFAIDGSLTAFATRFTKSVELLRLLGSGHEVSTLFRIDGLGLSRHDRAHLALWAAVLAAATVVGVIRSAWARYAMVAWGLVATALVAGVIQAGFWPGAQAASDWARPTLLFPLALIFVLVVGIGFRAGQGRIELSRGPVALAVFLLLLPHAYAFGTNNNYWMSGAQVGFFWVLGGLAALGLWFRGGGEARPTATIPAAFVLVLLAVVLVDKAFQSPYRQPPDLRRFASPYRMPDGSLLLLSPGFAEYLSTARQEGRTSGLTPQMDVIDLTGRSGGTLHALGLRSLGLPWLPGGYPGSSALAAEILAMQPCARLARAWILDEPEGSQRISPSVLGRFGADFATDYQRTERFASAEFPGWFGSGRRHEQQWLRPSREPQLAEARCEGMRAPRRAP